MATQKNFLQKSAHTAKVQYYYYEVLFFWLSTNGNRSEYFVFQP